MNARFGFDFSGVRVHTDQRASESARAVHAFAYTVGSDIAFAAGRYAPTSVEGRRLLAHELAHVIQQTRTPSPTLGQGPLSSANLVVSDPNDEAEREAAAASSVTAQPVKGSVWTGASVGNTAASQPIAIQRQYGYGALKWEAGWPDLPPEITVITNRSLTDDPASWFAAATRTGEVYMADSASMVRNVLQTLGSKKMARLNILDHGNPDGIQIGSDWITLNSVSTFAPILAGLNGHFAPGGFVHVQHCEAGQNLKLIGQLAAAFGVPVYAGTGMHNPVYRFNFGDYVRCQPDGSCQTDVSRP